MRYARFVENTWHPSPPTVEEGRCLVLPAELELQALWFSGAFGRDFTTKEGQPVKVVQFGEWNRGAGPDFHHALVAIGDLYSLLQRLVHFLVVQRIGRAVDEPLAIGDGGAAP